MSRTDPAYYSKYKIEPIEFIMANDVPYCEANVIKYIMRWRDKNGVGDLRKAIRYLDFLIEGEGGTNG